MSERVNQLYMVGEKSFPSAMKVSLFFFFFFFFFGSELWEGKGYRVGQAKLMDIGLTPLLVKELTV